MDGKVWHAAGSKEFKESDRTEGLKTNGQSKLGTLWIIKWDRYLFCRRSPAVHGTLFNPREGILSFNFLKLLKYSQAFDWHLKHILNRFRKFGSPNSLKRPQHLENSEIIFRTISYNGSPVPIQDLHLKCYLIENLHQCSSLHLVLYTGSYTFWAHVCKIYKDLKCSCLILRSGPNESLVFYFFHNIYYEKLPCTYIHMCSCLCSSLEYMLHESKNISSVLQQHIVGV